MTTFDLIVAWIANYQLLFLSGLIGAAAYRMQNYMPIKVMVKHVLASIFVSSLVCIVTRNFTDWSNDMIFVSGAVGGYFSSAIINEGKEIIDGLSDIVKEKLGKDDKKDENGEA